MNKPAFPRPFSEWASQETPYYEQDGMSMLEFYAGQALASAQCQFSEHELCAKWTFDRAEAMVKEAEKRSQ